MNADLHPLIQAHAHTHTHNKNQQRNDSWIELHTTPANEPLKWVLVLLIS